MSRMFKVSGISKMTDISVTHYQSCFIIVGGMQQLRYRGPMTTLEDDSMCTKLLGNFFRRLCFVNVIFLVVFVCLFFLFFFNIHREKWFCY